MPLKAKYTRGKIDSGGKKAGASNSNSKKKSIWKMIQENARKKGK